jgi:hypothetical protein
MDYEFWRPPFDMTGANLPHALLGSSPAEIEARCYRLQSNDAQEEEL